MRPPLPPFTSESAAQKVRLAEDGWNKKDPEKVSLAYTEDSTWRNRDSFIVGRTEIVTFLKRKWEKEREYRLVKELFAYTDNKIAVRYAYEFVDHNHQWFRAHGNENWEFDEQGLMAKRYASINDICINESQRLFLWDTQTRPLDYPSLSDFKL